MHRHIDFPSSSGKATIEALHWPYENPRGVVQLCHGMCEHIGRYDEFARFLNEHGFAVVGNNRYLGHGASLIDGQFGYFGDDGAYNYLIEDLELLRKRHRRFIPACPTSCLVTAWVRSSRAYISRATANTLTAL